jgi:hypothetical protein
MIVNLLLAYLEVSAFITAVLILVALVQGISYWGCPHYRNARDFKNSVKWIPYGLIWLPWILWTIFIFFPRLYLKARQDAD